jgi:rod shape-determining protein MreD
MAAAAPRPQELLLPAKTGLVVLSLAAAALVNLLPWSGLALVLRPDFVALVLLYWCINLPRRVGIGAAWLLGLLMDVADATLFGQHALAYSMLAFLGIVLHRRVLMFGLDRQVFHVLPMLFIADLASLLVALAGGAAFPGWWVFVPGLTGAALWPAVSLLLMLPRKPRSDLDGVA